VLQLKDLRGRTVGEKVTTLDEKILGELEGLPGGRAWGYRHERAVPTTSTRITHSVQLVKDYFKWFGWREIAGCLIKAGLGRVKNWKLPTTIGSNELSANEMSENVPSGPPRFPGFPSPVRSATTQQLARRCKRQLVRFVAKSIS
jgi:hypothetical protein